MILKNEMSDHEKKLIDTYEMLNNNYQASKKEIEEEFQKKKNLLLRTYAERNSKFKIGDFLKGTTGRIIKVNEIECSMLFDSPRIYYRGLPYKKIKGDFLRTKNKKYWIFTEDPRVKKID